MLTADTKRHIDAARQVLVGKVPNPISQIQEITNALVYKFMDDMDERAASMGGKRRYFTGEYARFSWRAIMDPKIGAHERIGLYTEALSRLSKNPNLPELFRNIFRNAYLPFNDGRVLTLFLKEIDYFDYSKSQELGDAYEYLLSIMGSQGDAGQFRTPRHIIDFMVAVINPTKSDSVLDPACGTAGFLISAYKHVMAQHDGLDEEGKPAISEKPLTADEKKHLHSKYKGFDIDDNMVKMAQVNLYLHGFPDPKIVVHDTLSSEDYWQDRYDVILANPPFMSPKGGSLPHSKFGIKSTRSEVLFVDYITSHLKPHGRAAIIVPEGIIFQSGKAHKELRKNLVQDGLYAVVSLPSGVFNPYAGVKTSILLFDNTRAKETDELIFVKINNDGYDLGATKRKIAQNDIPEAVEILNLWKQGEKSDSPLVLYVSKSKIADDGDYNLSGDRYRVATDYSNAKWPMVNFDDVVSTLTPPKKIPKEHFKKIGRFPIIDQSQNDISGWTDDESILIKSEKPLVIFGDHTCAVKYSEKPFAQGADGIKILLTNDNLIPKFLYYLLKIKPVESEGYHRHFTKLKRYIIPLPPLTVQEQIVAELDSYAAIIAGAKQIVVNWKPKIDINPEWQKVKLGGVCQFTQGVQIPKENQISEHRVGYKRYLYIQDFKGENKSIYVKDNYQNKELSTNDIVMANTGTPGRAFLAVPGILSNNLFRISFNNQTLNQKYLFYFLESDSFQSTLQSQMKGGIQKHLGHVTIANQEIPLPPLSIQKQIVARIEAERALVNSARKLIEIYEQKTKEAIAKLWSNDEN